MLNRQPADPVTIDTDGAFTVEHSHVQVGRMAVGVSSFIAPGEPVEHYGWLTSDVHSTPLSDLRRLYVELGEAIELLDKLEGNKAAEPAA